MINNIPNTSTLNNNRKKKLYNLYFKGRTAAGLGIAFNSPNKLLQYYKGAIIFKNNKGNNRGAILYWPNPKGKKIGLSFGNNSEFQKKFVIPYYANLMKTNGWYAETSGALEHILRKYHGIVPITNRNRIRRVLNMPNLQISNDGTYIRNIPGIGPHTKRLYGLPRV